MDWSVFVLVVVFVYQDKVGIVVVVVVDEVVGGIENQFVVGVGRFGFVGGFGFELGL